MRKGFWKRWLVSGAALAMAVGLCACGKKGSEADPSLAKENVYRLQELELPKFYEPNNGNVSFMASKHDREAGRVKLLIQVMDWSVEGRNYDFRLLSMNTDGSDLKMVSLDMPEQNTSNGGNAVVPETEGAPSEEPAESEAAPEEGTAADGARTAPAATEAADLPATAIVNNQTGETVPLPEENQVWEDTYYSYFALKTDGTVCALQVYNREDMSDPENPVRTSKSSLISWGEDGSRLGEVSLGEMDEYTGIMSMMEGADGALYLIYQVNNEDYSKTDYYRMKIDAGGISGERQKLADESIPLFLNNEQRIPREDGTLFVLFRDEDDWTKMFYTSYDVAADKVGEIKEFPSSITFSYNYNVMIPGLAHDLIYTSGYGIYCWDQGDTAGKPMLNYVNSDISLETLYSIVELSEQSFLGFYQEDWESGIKAGIFTYVKPEEIQDKKVLVLAGSSVDYSLKKRVIDYNRNNPDYRIVIKEYDNLNSYDDYTAGLNQLNSDIIAGNMPDILVNWNYSALPVNNYVSKGLLADIDKLISQDEELSKKEFMQNAFDAYRVKEKLYSIVPDFEIYTVIAKKSLVGDRESWTMADMQQVLEQMGGETRAFGGDVTRGNFINMVMRYCGNQFVDPANGKCNFNTEDFISMMEYAKQLPADEGKGGSDTIAQDFDWEEYWQNYESQYRQNRTLLQEVNFWRFDSVATPINGNMGEAVSYVGFPTGSGNGSYVMSSVTYLLSAKSGNLGEAWNFMRYYLTDEAQENVGYFPVRKDIFYEKSKQALKPRTYEWTDEKGETHVEEENLVIWINGEEVPYDPLSQEQLDELIAFIESVRNPYYYNDEVMKIINEEIEGYFTGQKPAADVADIIQRRVRNYVDENA